MITFICAFLIIVFFILFKGDSNTFDDSIITHETCGFMGYSDGALEMLWKEKSNNSKELFTVNEPVMCLNQFGEWILAYSTGQDKFAWSYGNKSLNGSETDMICYKETIKVSEFDSVNHCKKVK